MTEKELRFHGLNVEDFYMYKYKVDTCQKRYAHDWTSCLYAHSGESARRRDPSVYKPIPCPDSKGGNPCPRGDSCKYAHNDFEYWLHPGRYKTEYCKQGPSCNRKICFFAHRPEEIRKAPSVVYTNQGPFLDSETTAARNRQRQNGGSQSIASPWNILANKKSSSFNNAAYGDLSTMADLTNGLSSANHPYLPFSQDFNMMTAPAQQLLNQSVSSHGQYFDELRETGGLFGVDLSRQNDDSKSWNNLHNAVNALTLTNTSLQPSLSDASPLASHTPTTPWSATVPTFPYTANPFRSFSTEQFGNSDILALLQGLQQGHSLTHTPRSVPDEFAATDTFACSWSSDLINLAQRVSSEMKDESVLCSSISDGAIYAHPRLSHVSNSSTNTVISEQANGRF